MTRRRPEDSDLIGLIEGLDLPYEPLMLAHPLFVSGPEPEGFAMLPELPPEHGPLVLRVFRAVRAWTRGPRVAFATLTPEWMDPWEKEVLVSAYARAQEDAPDTELMVHLAVIVSELRRPEDANSEEVALRCLNVSDWALEAGMRETAMAFAELAALAWPSHCRYAWLAGRIFRSFGRMREAEAWLLRASRLAVWYKDWEGQALSLSSLGVLLIDLANLPAAESLHLKALRVARRHQLRKLEGEILHGLFVVAVEKGDRTAAKKYARGAFDIYRAGHERLAMLAHDVAYFWMNEGYFARSLKVLRELPYCFAEADAQLRVLANSARAAAGCKDQDLFETLWIRAWSLINEPGQKTSLASALVELGIGAAGLQNWEHASQSLEYAISVAQERGEANVVVRAERILDAVQKREVTEQRQRPRAGAQTVDDLFATEIVGSLRSIVAVVDPGNS